MGLVRDLPRGVVTIAGGQFLAALAVFVLGVVTARLLGPPGRGLFSAVTLSAVLAGSATLSAVPAVAYYRPTGYRESALAAGLIGGLAGSIATAYLLTVDGVTVAAALVPLGYAFAVVPVAHLTGRAL